MVEPETPDAPAGAANQNSETAPEESTGSVPVAAEESEAQAGGEAVAPQPEANSASSAAAEAEESAAGQAPVDTADEAAGEEAGTATGSLPAAEESETVHMAAATDAAEAAGTDFDALLGQEPAAPETPAEDLKLRAVLEAIVYVAEEPLPLAQLAASLNQPNDRVQALMEELIAEFDRPLHGVAIREVAGGYKMTTKPEHHEAVRNFVRSLKPPLKLSLAALETLAVIAYKQPITAPEIMEIRGVQGAGVLKTLLDRKLIAAAGRKNVIGKPILYKTTKEFLVQFGLKDLAELPSLKEFEELRRMAFSDSEPEAPPDQARVPEAAAAEPEAEPPAPEEPEPAVEPATPES